MTLGARRIRPRAEHLFAGAAFVLACVRGSGAPMTSDAGYHLLRAGNSLLTVSLHAYAAPPGGDHAPLLGALVTAFGAMFSGGGEAALLVPGCALLGAAAAALVLALARRGETSLAVLGVAFLLLPPAGVSSFTYRPDAALAGLLLLIAVDRQLRGGTATSVLVPVWASTLAAPWTLPAAITLQIAHARHRSTWLLPLGAGGLVAALSLALPAGARGEILQGLFGEVSLSADPAGRIDTIRRVWGGGLLLLGPLLIPLFVRAARLPAAVHVASAATALFLLVGGGHGAFRAGSAALLPVMALLFTIVAGTLPDARTVAGPRRPVLFALLLPLLLFLLGAREDAAERLDVRTATARDAQIAVFLRDQWKTPGDVMAGRTGALGAICDRTVRPLPTGPLASEDLPSVIVLGSGLEPAGARPVERALFLDPLFLARYTPLEFRRGRAVDIPDAVWVRVNDLGTVGEAYGQALLAAGEAHRAGDDDGERLALEQAQIHEPSGHARAREGLGLWHEREGHAEEAERYFDAARERDPFAIRARGHLIDRALARGGILRADTLVTEAIHFNPYLAELRGTRARLFAQVGALPEAIVEAKAAVRLAPRNGRLLTNWGILLWQTGRFDDARSAWQRAIRADSGMLSYLGDFDRAPTELPPPPLLPLFTDVGFTPLDWREDANRDE